MLKLKVSKTKHNRMIEHAKLLLKQREEAKWEICRIALEVCFIPDKKGGRYDKDKYSITNFAEDINMNRKTLSCWILDYQAVYKTLNIDESKMNYSERKRFNGAVTKTRMKLFNFDVISRGSINAVPAEKVKDTFTTIVTQDIVSKRLEDFIKNLGHHKYTLKHNAVKAKHLQLLKKYKKELVELEKLVDQILGR